MGIDIAVERCHGAVSCECNLEIHISLPNHISQFYFTSERIGSEFSANRLQISFLVEYSQVGSQRYLLYLPTSPSYILQVRLLHPFLDQNPETRKSTMRKPLLVKKWTGRLRVVGFRRNPDITGLCIEGS